MERSNPKRRTTYSRRDFLKGLGGGTTIMNARARGSRPDKELEAQAAKAVTLTVNGRSVSVKVDLAKVIASRAVLTLVA